VHEGTLVSPERAANREQIGDSPSVASCTSTDVMKILVLFGRGLLASQIDATQDENFDQFSSFTANILLYSNVQKAQVASNDQ
jgi:hypothetical protein